MRHFSRGGVRCLQDLSMHFSTYQEQVRPEVWFSQPRHTLQGGLAFRETAPAGFEVPCAGRGHGGKNYAGFLFHMCFCWWHQACKGRAGVAAMPLLESNYSDKSFHCVFLGLCFCSPQSDKVKVLSIGRILFSSPLPFSLWWPCVHGEVNLMFPFSSDSRFYWGFSSRCYCSSFKRGTWRREEEKCSSDPSSRAQSSPELAP